MKDERRGVEQEEIQENMKEIQENKKFKKMRQGKQRQGGKNKARGKKIRGSQDNKRRTIR